MSKKACALHRPMSCWEDVCDPSKPCGATWVFHSSAITSHVHGYHQIGKNSSAFGAYPDIHLNCEMWVKGKQCFLYEMQRCLSDGGAAASVFMGVCSSLHADLITQTAQPLRQLDFAWKSPTSSRRDILLVVHPNHTLFTAGPYFTQTAPLRETHFSFFVSFFFVVALSSFQNHSLIKYL